VEIIMVDLAGDSAVWVSTANDGSYSFTGDQLASLTPGMYVMVLNHYNRESIAAEGYDPRSIIAARVMTHEVS
jgi:sulfur transfer protein SufE